MRLRSAREERRIENSQQRLRDGDEGEDPLRMFHSDWVFVPVSTVVHHMESPPPLTPTYIVDPETQIDGLDGEEPVNRFHSDWALVPVSTDDHQRESPQPLTPTYIALPDTETEGAESDEPVNRFQLD